MFYRKKKIKKLFNLIENIEWTEDDIKKMFGSKAKLSTKVLNKNKVSYIL